MRRALLAVTLLALVLGSATTLAAATPTVPPGFQVTLLDNTMLGPKGIICPPHRAGAGPFGQDLYIAESGRNQVVKLDREGTALVPYASTLPFGTFPVGVSIYGGPFAQNLFVGVAFGGGILRMDPYGAVAQFALPGMSIAGMDFGRGEYGFDLFAGQWNAGNIWRVDAFGNATLFATCGLNCQTRYLKFSHGARFGTFLYFTDFMFGDIYRVDAKGNVALFASLGTPCLEGFDFSAGGAFGHFLYAGDVCTGDIFQVAPDGTSAIWGSGFDGVADLIFMPGRRGGFTMYLVDGNTSAFAVSKK